MAATFSNVKRSLDVISARIATNDSRVAQARELLVQVNTDISSLQTEYSSLVADIDATAAANPLDAAWKNAKAEKDLLVADFQALKALAIDLLAAYDSV